MKLGQGYIFTGVRHSVNRGGACSKGVPAPGGSGPGGTCSGGGPGGCLLETPPGTATAAGGTHPTGMHSCCILFQERKNEG